jgi:hypothetical protein
MSVATLIMELSKEMENKMEKTFTQLEKALIAEIKLEYPTYGYDLVNAVFLGKVLAYTEKATLEKLLSHYYAECSRCGEYVLPSEHPEIGCDL